MKARSVSKINSIGTVWVFSLVLIFGIIFTFFAFKLMQQKIPPDYVETEATITRIEEVLSPTYVYSDSDLDPSNYEYHVFVKYSYGGKDYTDLEYGSYSSSMKEGDTVLLYCDPDDPTIFMSDPSDHITFLIVGIVVVLIGIGGLVFCIYKKKRRIN